MALVVVDGDQVVNLSFGDTSPGNHQRPRSDSLIRIASITKLMTSEMMVKLAAAGRVKLTDPLRNYAPKGAYVPTYNSRQPITMLNLATHTSTLPREQPGKKPSKTPVFTWPTMAQRWHWLAHSNITMPPGVRASYSNLAYDPLADALSRAAGKSYSALMKERITAPLGIIDTTLTPSAEQYSRLMVAAIGSSACRNTTAAGGSGGIYSTRTIYSAGCSSSFPLTLSARANPLRPVSIPCISNARIWCRCKAWTCRGERVRWAWAGCIWHQKTAYRALLKKPAVVAL